MQVELDTLQREYDSFRIQAFNEKTMMLQELSEKSAELEKHREDAENLRSLYDEAKTRLDKERDVAFDLAADLRAQLNAATVMPILA